MFVTLPDEKTSGTGVALEAGGWAERERGERGLTVRREREPERRLGARDPGAGQLSFDGRSMVQLPPLPHPTIRRGGGLLPPPRSWGGGIQEGSEQSEPTRRGRRNPGGTTPSPTRLVPVALVPPGCGDPPQWVRTARSSP